MSQGEACQKHGREWWFVVARKVNYSAFNGYHATPSDYSEVRCGHPAPEGHRTRGVQYAGARWRTKAAYVDDLPDEEQWKPPTTLHPEREA